MQRLISLNIDININNRTKPGNYCQYTLIHTGDSINERNKEINHQNLKSDFQFCFGDVYFNNFLQKV